jgi:ferredoxin-fold anticodon binding domain-containing protein
MLNCNKLVENKLHTWHLSKKKLKAEDASSEDKKDVDAKKKVGNILSCESMKNRLCPEEEKIEIYLSFSTGPNRYFGLAEDAVNAGVFKKVNEKNFIVNHLGDKKIHISKLYNNEVFTKEVLDKIDEYCRKTYKYSQIDDGKSELELASELDEEPEAV